MSSYDSGSGKADLAGSATAEWQEKLDFLRRMEAQIAEPAQLFSVRQQIREAERKISGHSTEPPRKSFWNVPRRNPFFTGHSQDLRKLHEVLQDNGRDGQRQAAIAGLGGIGKTQIATEYCHLHSEDFSAVFWIRAGSETEIRTDLADMARHLGLNEADAPDQDKVAAAVLRWLETRDDWLLVFDNADQPEILRPFLPHNPKGRLLLTSRASAFATVEIREPLRVKPLSPSEAQFFLLDRTERKGVSDKELAAVSSLAEELGYLPLALEQAAAFMTRSGARFQEYLASYREHRLRLLEEERPQAGGYPESLARTWSVSFSNVEKKSPASANFLRVLAFLTSDGIPLEIFEKGEASLRILRGERWWRHLWRSLTGRLAPAPGPLAVAQVVAPLLSYSLIEHNVENRTISIHRMVQAVIRDGLDKERKRVWVERAIRALTTIFPAGVEFDTWALCERLYPQVPALAGHVERLLIDISEVPRLLMAAGTYAHRRANYGEAEVLYQRALAIWEKTFGSHHTYVGDSLNNLGELYESQGRYEKAEPLYRRALDIRKKALGPNHPDVGQTLNDMAILYKNRGRYEEAEPLYREALAIRRRAFGPEHFYVGETLNNLAILYNDQGRYEKAKSLYEQALAIREKALGAEHPHVGSSLNNLANLYATEGSYKEAEPLYRRALGIREKVLGLEHPDVGSSLNNLALLYTSQGRYEEAEPLFQRALEIWEKALGPEHPDVGTSLNNLADLYRERGRYEEAEPLCQRALAIREKALGLEHPYVGTSLNNLADLYTIQSRYEEAESLYQRALAIKEKALGSEHPSVGYTVLGLANLRQKQNRSDEAEPLFRRALVLRERVLGPDHPLTVQARGALETCQAGR